MGKTTPASTDSATARTASGTGRFGRSPLLWRGFVSLVGGAVAALGWLPPHSPALLVLGVATILWVTQPDGDRGLEWTSAGVVGLVGSIAFFAISNRPLVSAVGWGGWGSESGTTLGSASWWLLNGLWIILSAWCALFWSAAFALYARCDVRRPWLRVLWFASVWVGVAEWLRSISHWKFEWGFLGLGLADVSSLRQWSSIGGILLLSTLIAAASALLVELARKGSRKLPLAAGAVVAGVVIWFGGDALKPTVDKTDSQLRVAAFQFAPSVPPAGETPLGVSPDWFGALPSVVERNYRLIVLPESISSHAVQLDGTSASSLGSKRQVSADAWQRALEPLLPTPDRYIALGVEGVEAGDTFNTTTVWSRDGLVGWQHKVYLVPFAEYLPRGWGFLGSQALTYYRPGPRYEPVEAGAFRLGNFICQEVQHGGTSRKLARNGANLLITGGNDGVFADRRVAELHHSWARIRATEVDRFLVRSMKNGITSIIGPDGEVVGRSPGEGPALVGDSVTLRTAQTLWTRLGSWPLLLAALGCLFVQAATARRR